VQLITATLAVTGWFERDVAECSNCHQLKQVIRAVETPQVGTPA
jgi:hypothetical protein